LEFYESPRYGLVHADNT